jgi:hypothetical protein
MEAVPTVSYLVFGAAEAPPLPGFGRAHHPSGAEDFEPPLIGFAVAPAGRESAGQWLAAVPPQRWVFIFASSADEAQWLASQTTARVMYANTINAALAPAPMRETPYGPMLEPSELERCFGRAAQEFSSVASAMAEAKADREEV